LHHTKIKVLVVDDHPFLREGLISWINRQPDLVCCGEAESARAAGIAIDRLHPDVVLLDLRLPDRDGLDLIRDLCALHPGLRILVISQNDELTFAHRALKAGARGYVMKSEATDQTLAAIRTVMAGGLHISSPAAATLLEHLFPDPTAKRSDLTSLSDRELQVFMLRGTGRSNHDIAKHLGISVKTVETHCEKLQFRGSHRQRDRWHL
jgi:DNA-binding NarL/FixJ family response regulator